MTERAKRIESEARKLGATERERLAVRILAGLSTEPLNEIDEAWLREAERRYRAWRKDESRGLSADAVLRGLRKDLSH